jgi:hypothetical protein
MIDHEEHQKKTHDEVKNAPPSQLNPASGGNSSLTPNSASASAIHLQSGESSRRPSWTPTPPTGSSGALAPNFVSGSGSGGGASENVKGDKGGTASKLFKKLGGRSRAESGASGQSHAGLAQGTQGNRLASASISSVDSQRVTFAPQASPSAARHSTSSDQGPTHTTADTQGAPDLLDAPNVYPSASGSHPHAYNPRGHARSLSGHSQLGNNENTIPGNMASNVNPNTNPSYTGAPQLDIQPAMPRLSLDMPAMTPDAPRVVSGSAGHSGHVGSTSVYGVREEGGARRMPLNRMNTDASEAETVRPDYAALDSDEE